MSRPRISIAQIGAVVAAVALNLAAVRNLDRRNPFGMVGLFYVCAILPMASLLTLSALRAWAAGRRGARIGPSFVGFQAAGWAGLFVMLTAYSLAPERVARLYELILKAAILPLLPSEMHVRPWLGEVLEYGTLTAFFAIPELVLALLGGRLAGRPAIRARFVGPAIEGAATA